MVVKVMDEVREPTTPSKVGSHGPFTKGYDGNPVQLDHCYAKPWNWRQETAHCKPVRTLFSEDSSLASYEEPIDVGDEGMPPKNGRLIDREATNNSFIDAEERLSLISSENDAADWEETVKRDGWTPLQHRIFNKVVKLLVGDNMARLATAKTENEAVQKKILIEGSSKKLRIILSSVAWDVKITQWLHLTLIEHLSRDYLLCYISILQVLRSKVPTLVDRMLTIPVANMKLLYLNNQIVGFVTNKPWEPVLAPINLSTDKLPVAPVIVMVPSGTNNSFFSNHGTKRHQTWLNLFQTLGKVVTVSLPNAPPPHSLPLPTFVECLINATVQKVQESRTLFPGRPIVLAGIQQGALVAAQVAQAEPVAALIFLGFPLFCVDGKRGDPDDFILDLRAPTMFVIGQSSSNCTIDGIEQMRYRMKAESYLVVVDGAMDSLRMLKWKKKQQNLTQAMVDSAILGEIATFLTNVLSQPPAPGSGKKSPVERKPEVNSSAGGLPKRPRYTLEPDEGNHSALSGHNYSQNTPFHPPWKGRSGTGLARVRGGRIGPTQNRTPQQKSQPESSPTPGKLRIGRPLSAGTYRLQGGTVEAITPTKTKFHRQPSGQSDIECDGKSSVDSSQNSPKDELGSTVNSESRGGGDSSETESAPPPEDDEEMMMEDFRFANELMSKQNSTPLKGDDDNPDDEFSLRFSGDEADDLPAADVGRRLSAENRAQSRNRTVGSPE